MLIFLPSKLYKLVLLILIDKPLSVPINKLSFLLAIQFVLLEIKPSLVEKVVKSFPSKRVIPLSVVNHKYPIESCVMVFICLSLANHHLWYSFLKHCFELINLSTQKRIKIF